MVRSLACAAWALLVVGAASSFAAMPPPCNAPCLENARGENRDCIAAAQESFRDGIDGCLERDHTCVNACRSLRQECREDTGRDAELLGCDLEAEQAKGRCRSEFPIGSRKRERCIDRAQLAAIDCRRTVRRSFRQELRQCQHGFDPCVETCGPGTPPDGSESCKDEERQALQAALADCKTTFVATSRACANRDGACIQDCADTRQTCASPIQATLDAALTACRTAETAAVAACQAAGGPDLEQCITTAQSDAFTCRDAAVDASVPGFAACTEQFLGCVAACPPA